MTIKEKKDFILAKCYSHHNSCTGCPLASQDIDCNVAAISDEEVNHCYDLLINQGDTWSQYITYLKTWIESHADPKFEGTSPACYEEWLADEFT